MKSVLRRLRDQRKTAEPVAVDIRPEMVRMGAWTLDLAAHRLRGADGDTVHLTSMEFDLLKAFADHPDRVLSRDRLLELAHHRAAEAFDRSIDLRIARIRRKIEVDAGKPQVLKTVRGAGYMFVSGRKR